MHKEKDIHGTKSDEDVNSWLRSGSLGKLTHISNTSRRSTIFKSDKETKYCLENDNAEKDLRRALPPHKKKRPELADRQPTLIVSPMSELSVEYKDGIPSIKVTDFSATPQDIEDRIAEQAERISAKNFSERTPAEKKWLEKRNNTGS